MNIIYFGSKPISYENEMGIFVNSKEGRKYEIVDPQSWKRLYDLAEFDHVKDLYKERGISCDAESIRTISLTNMIIEQMNITSQQSKINSPHKIEIRNAHDFFKEILSTLNHN